MVNSVTKNYRYTLTTITPVHIGNGEIMSPLEFFIHDRMIDGDAVADRIIVPDLEKLFAQAPKLAENFSHQLQRKAAHDLATTTFNELIGDNKIASPIIDETRRYSTRIVDTKDLYHFAMKQLRAELSKRKPGEVRLATKDARFRAYIPGSSIKGALRTAWLYAQCCEHEKILNSVLKEIDTGYKKAVAGDNALKKEIIQSDRDAFNGCYDLFRVVQIGDSEALPANEVLCLVAERVLSAGVRNSNSIATQTNVNANYKDYWVFCESIYRNLNFTGRIAFQNRLLKDAQAQQIMGWKREQESFTLERLIKAVNRFAADSCQWEIDYYQQLPTADHYNIESILKFYQERLAKIKTAPDDTCYLSIGHGAGWHKMTIGMLLADKKNKQRMDQFIQWRERSGLNLAPDRTDFQFPKSRKLAMKDQQLAQRPLGWVKLKLDEMPDR